MSGGSWDYLCYKVADAANQLVKSKCPRRKSFGHHLRLVAEALHDIEWVDSCDLGEGDEIKNIMKCITPREVLYTSLEDAKKTVLELSLLIAQCEKEV